MYQYLLNPVIYIVYVHIYVKIAILGYNRLDTIFQTHSFPLSIPISDGKLNSPWLFKSSMVSPVFDGKILPEKKQKNIRTMVKRKYMVHGHPSLSLESETNQTHGYINPCENGLMTPKIAILPFYPHEYRMKFLSLVT